MRPFSFRAHRSAKLGLSPVITVAMPIIESQIDTKSAEFQSNAAHMRGVVDDL